MEMRNLSEDIVLVELQREPQLRDELRTITDVAGDRDDCDVILDFSKVDIVTSSGLSKMLKLRQVLTDGGHRLILCGLHEFTRSAFEVTGLEGHFEVVKDRTAACEALERVDLANKSD